MSGDIVTGSELGPEFDLGNIQTDKVRLKLGAGLAIQPDGTIVATSTALTALMTSDIQAGQDVNVNVNLLWTPSRTDTGWQISGANIEAQYTGTPDSVDVTVMVENEIADNVNRQRPSPNLLLQKFTGGVWQTIIASRTGYIRDTNDHEESSNTIAWTDPAPGPDPRYRVQSFRETNIQGVVTAGAGTFCLRAWK